MPGAVMVISLRKQIVVLSESVPHVCNQGEPGRRRRGGVAEALAGQGVIYRSFEFVLWNSRRQTA